MLPRLVRQLVLYYLLLPRCHGCWGNPSGWGSTSWSITES